MLFCLFETETSAVWRLYLDMCKAIGRVVGLDIGVGGLEDEGIILTAGVGHGISKRTIRSISIDFNHF